MLLCEFPLFPISVTLMMIGLNNVFKDLLGTSEDTVYCKLPDGREAHMHANAQAENLCIQTQEYI